MQPQTAAEWTSFVKKRLVLLLKIAVSAVLVWILFRKIDWSQFAIPQRSMNAGLLFCGVLGGIAFNLIKFLKWQALITAGCFRHSYWDAAKSYMIGNSLGLATPLRVGEFGRALYFLQSERPRIMSLTVIDRAMELVVVLMLAVAGVFVLLNRTVAVVIACSASAGLVVMFCTRKLEAAARKMANRGGMWGKTGQYLVLLGSVDARTTSIALALSMAAFVAVILQLYFLVAAFESVNVGSVFLAGPLITLSSIMPVSFMGLGVREGISAVLFSGFGVSAPTAVAAAFLLFLINNVIMGLVGVFFLWRLG